MLQEHSIHSWIPNLCHSYLEEKERQIYLTRLLCIMTQSDQLWYQTLSGYEEVLLETLYQFCQDFNTSDVSGNGDWEQVIQTFQQDLKQQMQHSLQTEATSSPDHLPLSPTQTSDSSSLVTQIYEWVKKDTKGDLQNTYLSKHPTINCQTLIQKRLPPTQSWEEISAEFDVSIEALSHFYQQECLPRLRRFSVAIGEFQRIH